jgi:hypothetical protein
MSHVGMGYMQSEMNRSRTAMGAGNIIKRLGSRSVTGHALHIQVHQHCGYEFHIVLKDDVCIRRGCYTPTTALRICAQLVRGLEGVHTCVLDERRVLSMSDKVKPCFRADPVPEKVWSPCGECDSCLARGVETIQFIRWLRKNRQSALHFQRDICCCRSMYVEMLD